MRTYFINVAIIVCVLFALSPACTQKEIPKRVSLNKKMPDTALKTTETVKDVLKFGFDLRLDPKEDARIYTPFLEYLEKSTGKYFSMKITEKYEDTVENLANGVTHFASFGSLSYVIGREKYGDRIKYLVSGLNKNGEPEYSASIFIKPGDAISNIKDLKGKCFAFGSRMSAQGHLIPREMLDDAGISLNDLGRHVFTVSHIDTMRTVLNGECDAGGIPDTLAERLASEGKIKIMGISKPYPGSIIAYNTGVDSKTVQAVRSALMALEPGGRHRDILVDWDKTEMASGFANINEAEFYQIAVLARRYGLLTK